MSASFNKIDYQLRPAKAVERKMMAEIFGRLSVFGALDTYQYVGMGSVYFADFTLFHAACGFGSMVSIEGTDDKRIQKRCRFNAPVALDLHFKKTTAAFSQIDWKKRSVVWLDYDDPLDRNALADLAYLADRLTSGSVLALSCNAEREKLRTREQLLEYLKDQVGPDKVPDEANEDKLVDQKRYLRIIRATLAAEVARAVDARNAGRAEAEKVSARQIFFYSYKDGAQMLTLGWLLTRTEDEAAANLARIPSIKHAQDGVTPFEIDIPKLTPAEMRAISRSGGSNAFESENEIPLLREEIARFRKIERYWPITRFLELG